MTLSENLVTLLSSSFWCSRAKAERRRERGRGKQGRKEERRKEAAARPNTEEKRRIRGGEKEGRKEGALPELSRAEQNRASPVVRQQSTGEHSEKERERERERERDLLNLWITNLLRPSDGGEIRREGRGRIRDESGRERESIICS